PPLPYTTLFRSSGIGHSSTKVHDVIEATDASTMISCSSMGRPRSRPTGSCGSRALARRSASAPARGVRGCGRALDAELGPLPLGLVLELLVALPGADPAFEEQPVPVHDEPLSAADARPSTLRFPLGVAQRRAQPLLIARRGVERLRLGDDVLRQPGRVRLHTLFAGRGLERRRLGAAAPRPPRRVRRRARPAGRRPVLVAGGVEALVAAVLGPALGRPPPRGQVHRRLALPRALALEEAREGDGPGREGA